MRKKEKKKKIETKKESDLGPLTFVDWYFHTFIQQLKETLDSRQSRITDQSSDSYSLPLLLASQYGVRTPVPQYCPDSTATTTHYSKNGVSQSPRPVHTTDFSSRRPSSLSPPLLGGRMFFSPRSSVSVSASVSASSTSEFLVLPSTDLWEPSCGRGQLCCIRFSYRHAGSDNRRSIHPSLAAS